MLESGVSQWPPSGQLQWPGISPGPTDDIGQLTFQAFQEQQQIGWDQAIRGQWSKKWAKQIEYTVSAGCIKEIQIYMLGGCLVW